MIEILLAIAGSILGGGMIGQLIVFFTKRRDKKNDATNRLMSNLIKNISEVQKTISAILDKTMDANNQRKNLLQQQIDFLEKVHNNEKALAAELTELYNNNLEHKDICEKCIEIQKRYPIIDIEANKVERKSIELKIVNETNEYIRVQIKELDIFPNLSSDFLCLKKSNRSQLLPLTYEYQRTYNKMKYRQQEDDIEAQWNSTLDKDLFELLALLEQMKYVLSNYIKY